MASLANPHESAALSAKKLRSVHRQTQSVVLGGAVIVVCALILVLGLRSRSGLHPIDVIWPVALSLLAWAIFVRPAVVLTQVGVTLRNIVRETHIPWSQVDDTGSRWNLKVWTTDGASYGSWAIAAQRPHSPRAQRGMGGFGGLGPGAPTGRDIDAPAHLNPTQRSQSAGSVAEKVQQGRRDYDLAVGDGQVPAADGSARRVPAWPGIAALGGAVVLTALGFLV